MSCFSNISHTYGVLFQQFLIACLLACLRVKTRFERMSAERVNKTLGRVGRCSVAMTRHTLQPAGQKDICPNNITLRQSGGKYLILADDSLRHGICGTQ